MPKLITLEVSEFVHAYMDDEAMIECLEAEALKCYHRQRSKQLSREEKELRAFLGQEAYSRLTPIEKQRMLACVEVHTEGSSDNSRT